VSNTATNQETPAAASTNAAAAAAGAAGTPAANAGTPETAARPDGQAPAAGDAAAAAAAAKNNGQTAGTAAGAPEKYSLTLPEGGLLDQEDLTALETLARTKNLTNEQAQAALTEHNDALVAQGARFLEATNAHPEIGGAKLEAAQVNATRALDRFLPATTPEGAALRSALNKTGYGNHPSLVLLLSRIGKAMAEDRPLGSGDTGGATRTVEQLFYGSNA
jgi:hypothetical protein